MDELDRVRLTRRIVVVVVYGVATSVLIDVVAGDLAWVSAGLAEIGATVPQDARPVDDPATFVTLASGVLAAGLALGTFLASRRTGTGFGLLSAATVTWTLFPYAQVPWAAVLGGPTNQTHAAPAGAWIVAASIVLVATLEIGISAREQLLDRLDELGLDTAPASPARSTSLTGTVAWLAGSVLVGLTILGLYALARSSLEGFVPDPDLLWVPSLAGLVAGLALWLWARE